MHSSALEFPYTLSECEEINSTLYKPINSTQRIKYTCFNASPGYIVLGSTSGSVYLFTREPCSFLQIIPLSEGVVSRVAISPDEKSIALATTRGTVCLISLKPTPRLIAISIQHICEQITSLCWSDNSSEIYIGDAVGRVSIMVLSIFTVNSMFQTPTCILMNLDSSIVQLNFCSPLLLVSTLTRCYICDTVQEQYKQIGNKTRNGEFGACFYKAQMGESSTSNVYKEERNINMRSAFNLISDNDSNILGENQPQIFCARPGSRLWEVSTDGVVGKTHQFKEVLAIPPVAIFRPATLKSSQKTEWEWPPQSVNFSHLFIIAQKYLFSYTTNGLYIIDLANATVVLWSNEFTNISMADVVDNRIYLMTCDNEFHCLTLSSLDTLILRLYHSKNYYECLNACIVYKSQLSNIIGSEIIHISEFDLSQSSRNEEVLRLLRPLISYLQTGADDRPVKLDSGIVVVNSGNKFVNKQKYNCEIIHTPRSPDTSSEYSPLTRILKSTKDFEGNIARGYIAEPVLAEITDLNYEEELVHAKDGIERDVDSYQTFKPEEKITYKMQSDLEPVYTLVNSIRPTMSEREIERISIDVNKIMRKIKEFYKESPGLQSFLYEVMRAAELHYYNFFLENTSVQLLHSTDNDHIVRQFVRAFIEINAQSYTRCNCGYPYPVNKVVEPKFLAVGEYLIRKFADDLPQECMNICNKVPYMWREYLPIRLVQHTLDDLLRQCLQTRDKIVLSFLLPALNEQQWNAVEACLNEIKNGNCLFCAMPLTKKSDYDVLIDWGNIVKEIMKREGPDEATAFLTKLESAMPNVTIDKSIFQSIIFTKMLYHRGVKKSIEFSKNDQLSSEFATMCSLEVRNQLTKALEKDLGQPIDKNMFGAGPHHWGVRMAYQAKSLTCPCCTLSLQTPVLLGNNGIAIFRCGHAYHVNCLIERKLTKCNLHQ